MWCSEISGENLTPPSGRSLRSLPRLAGQAFAWKIPPGAGRVIPATEFPEGMIAVPSTLPVGSLWSGDVTGAGQGI